MAFWMPGQAHEADDAAVRGVRLHVRLHDLVLHAREGQPRELRDDRLLALKLLTLESHQRPADARLPAAPSA